MLNLPRIARLAEFDEFDRLFSEVIRNGRPLPLGIRLRLSESAALPAASLALALSRVVQLTYRPTPVSRVLVDRLMAQRTESDIFPTLASTTVALAALLAFADQVAALPGGKGETLNAATAPIDPALHAEIHRTIAACLHHLHEMQAETDLLGEPVALLGDEVDTAIALWQLALDPRFAAAVRYEELLASVENRGLRHNRTVAPLLEGITPPPSGTNRRTNAA